MADSPPPAVTFSEAYAQHPDKGGAFAQFVGEMFADAGDGLSNFLAPGKDGAIDLYDATRAGVWECKFVGRDGIDDARARWAEVATHLRDNLLPGAPKPGQAQYAPWYDASQPIAHYRFCTSARLANLAQCQAMEQEISAHFAMLAQRAGLQHLAGIDVEVWTWDRIEPALSRRPQLRLRWFNTGWPIGVREFSRVLQHPHSGFAAYLYGSSRLNYVALGDALCSSALLGDLAKSARCSTVLHGRGGAGKSRLMLEVGHAALAAGWVVLQVQAHTTPVDELAGVVRAAGQAQVLLLMDYVERCVTWDKWIAQLQALADAGAKVKLLGTCRSSWVDRLDSYQTDLVPLPEALPAAVNGILAQRPGLADMASVCRDVPVFAAFLCLLYDTGKVQALESLRQQQDFNRWLQAHIARWPGTAALALPGHCEALVELLLNLPCADAALRQLEIEQPAAKAYREQLCQDGWLACDLDAPTSEQWATLHDVLADGAVLLWLASRGAGRADPQMLRWLQTARERGTLQVLLRSLQRLAAEPAVQALNWPAIFGGADAPSWAPWRSEILTTRLLPALDALAWMEQLPFGVEDAITTEPARAALDAALAQWQADNDWPGASVEDSAIGFRLQRWLDAAVQALAGNSVALNRLTSNRLLVRAMRWQPDRYVEAAAQWLNQHAEQEQAQFLLNAWLHIPAAQGAKPPRSDWWCRWLAANRLSSVASFVFKSWLDAGGEISLVKDAVLAWLKIEQHATSAEARFVFTSWLDAEGEISLVKDAVRVWLSIEQHATSAEAQFVFKSWLDAGGEISLIKDAVQAWLKIEQHATSAEASFVFKSWLDAGGEISLVKDVVLAWLKIEQHANSAEAHFVFNSWLDNMGQLDDIDAYCHAWLAVESNSQSENAGYLFCAYGDRMKHLPPWMAASAEKWFQVWRESPKAVYALKYVVRIQTMQAATACSVVDWCRQFSDHADALDRFARLGHKISAYPDRAELIRIGVYLIAGATNRVALNSGEQHRFLLLSALTGLAELDRLPLRDGHERQAAGAIPQAACAVFVSVSGAEPARLDGHPPEWIDALVGADWERLVKAGLSAGAPNPGQVRAGAAVWARMCLPWAMDLRNKASLTRLAALAGTTQV